MRLFLFFSSVCLNKIDLDRIGPIRQTTLTLAGQPKALATAADGTLFIVHVEKTGRTNVQAVRDNQAIYTLQPTYKAISVAASGSVVVVGGEVRCFRIPSVYLAHPGTDNDENPRNIPARADNRTTGRQ